MADECVTSSLLTYLTRSLPARRSCYCGCSSGGQGSAGIARQMAILCPYRRIPILKVTYRLAERQISDPANSWITTASAKSPNPSHRKLCGVWFINSSYSHQRLIWTWKIIKLTLRDRGYILLHKPVDQMPPRCRARSSLWSMSIGGPPGGFMTYAIYHCSCGSFNR